MRHQTKGFTLLEMLFVLVIVGLLVGLSAPRLGAGIDRYELLLQRQDIEDQLRQLPRRARLSVRSIELPSDLALLSIGDGPPPMLLPEGWTISFTPPLIISRTGACSASRIQLQSAKQPDTSNQYQVSELTCELLTVSP